MLELIKKDEGLNDKQELTKIKAGWECGSAGIAKYGFCVIFASSMPRKKTKLRSNAPV